MTSRSFAKTLRNELSTWVADKLITETQGKKIIAKYPLESENHALVPIIAMFGAILIGVGILTLVALNWDKIPAMLRVLILFAGTLGSYAAGYLLKYRSQYSRVGSAIIFLGAILVGVSIILIAQIYHLESLAGHWLLLWALAIIPVAYAVQSKASHVLGTLLTTYWLGIQFGRLAVQGAGATIGTIEPMAALFMVWPLTVVFFLSLGITAWAIGRFHKNHGTLQSYAPIFKNLGSILILGAFYFLTFRFFIERYWTWEQFQTINPWTFPLLWIVLITAMIIFGVASVMRKERYDKILAAAFCGMAILATLVVTFPGFRETFRMENANDPIITPLSLLMNVVFLAILVLAIAYAMRTSDNFILYLAMLLFAVDILTRYIEFFWDRLSGGLFFIITGVILLILSFAFEKARRTLTHQTTTPIVQPRRR